MNKKRKIIRKKDHDYSEIGSYFITICTKDRSHYFGEIKNNIMKLSELGKISTECFLQIPKHFLDIQIDEFVIMPNHIHGIIHIVEEGKPHGAGIIHGLSVPLSQIRMYERLPIVINQYKSSVSRLINKSIDNVNFKWQRSYHDRIIRNELELQRIREYIFNNVSNWKEDSLNPVGVIV